MMASVKHRRYGSGEVIRERYGGFELQVRFGNGILRWLRRSELRLDASPALAVDREEPKPQPRAVEGKQTARRMIEAFRLGIVPRDCVDKFTFGRSSELQTVSTWLDSDAENVLLLVGEYGAGKTHLLHHIRDRALHSGYVVSVVETDPGEAPFDRPKKIYHHCVKELRFLSKKSEIPCGFRQFVLEALERGDLGTHPYFKHAQKAEERDLVWEWIEAGQSGPRPYYFEPTPSGWSFHSYWDLPNLYDHSTAANIYTYLLSSLSWVAHNGMGYSGLLVLFDESESVAMAGSGYRREKASNFLSALARVANNDHGIDGRPSSTGLIYSRMDRGASVPFAFRLPSRLKLLFAVTPGFEGWLPCELRWAPSLSLTPLSRSAYDEIFSGVLRLYGEAYGLTRLPASVSEVHKRLQELGGTTRQFVKGSVEIADLARFTSRQR